MEENFKDLETKEPVRGRSVVRDSAVKESVSGGSRSSKLLERLVSAHNFYKEGTEQERGRILDAMENTFEDIREIIGLDKSFGVLYTLYGEVFINFEHNRGTLDFASLEELIARYK